MASAMAGMRPTDAVGESGGREGELTAEELQSSGSVVDEEEAAVGELDVGDRNLDRRPDREREQERCVRAPLRRC